MKKILSTLLAVGILMTAAVSMTSCFVTDAVDTVKGWFITMEKIEEKCEKLEREGEIDGYTYSKLTNTITVYGDDKDEVCYIVEFKNEEQAKEAYEEYNEELEEAKELFEDLKEGASELGYKFDLDFDDFLEDYGFDIGYCKRFGTIVIYGNEDLCKEII